MTSIHWSCFKLAIFYFYRKALTIFPTLHYPSRFLLSNIMFFATAGQCVLLVIKTPSSLTLIFLAKDSTGCLNMQYAKSCWPENVPWFYLINWLQEYTFFQFSINFIRAVFSAYKSVSFTVRQQHTIQYTSTHREVTQYKAVYLYKWAMIKSFIILGFSVFVAFPSNSLRE